MLRALKPASGLQGETKTDARDGAANRRTTKGGGMVRRGSECPIVPGKRANSPHGEPVEGRGR